MKQIGYFLIPFFLLSPSSYAQENVKYGYCKSSIQTSVVDGNRIFTNYYSPVFVVNEKITDSVYYKKIVNSFYEYLGDHVDGYRNKAKFTSSPVNCVFKSSRDEAEDFFNSALRQSESFKTDYGYSLYQFNVVYHDEKGFVPADSSASKDKIKSNPAENKKPVSGKNPLSAGIQLQEGRSAANTGNSAKKPEAKPASADKPAAASPKLYHWTRKLRFVAYSAETEALGHKQVAQARAWHEKDELANAMNNYQRTKGTHGIASWTVSRSEPITCEKKKQVWICSQRVDYDLADTDRVAGKTPVYDKPYSPGAMDRL